MVCRCENACSTCACAKSNRLCSLDCHGKKNWSSVSCMNTEEGKKVKAMKIGDIRTALCANNLSPVGDKSELMKRLADFFREKTLTKSSMKSEDKDTVQNMQSDGVSRGASKELFAAIIENEGQSELILSLSGKVVSAASNKADLRRAYLLLSSKLHPDKNGQSKESIQVFQILLAAYEQLSNPQKIENLNEKPAKKRRKTERVERSNTGCYKTIIKCPQCKQTWGTADMGLEEPAYNFFMLAMKQYICGRCACEFGCMTGIHYCPHCNREFDYDPDNYRRKVTCGHPKCQKEFGFWMFKVSEKREQEVRHEAKVKHEAYRKKLAQKNRRAARADKRGVSDMSSNDRLQEKLFVICLRDTCPRCGYELEKGEGSEEAKEHLNKCNDKNEIAKYKQKLKKEKAKIKEKEDKKLTQQEMMSLKQWEHNGRQVGQLWMLTDKMLEKQCKDCRIDSSGERFELITRLSKHLRSNATLMITDGKANSMKEVQYDTGSIGEADEEDLPKNLHEMEKEELQDVCASYGIDFNSKRDAKLDLIKKFESARLKGQKQLMLCDKPKLDSDSESDIEDEKDEDYIA